MKKFSLIAIIVMFLSSFFVTSASANQFPDLLPWAEDKVLYLSEEGIISGYPNGNFGSRDSIKRGDVALMLAKAKKLDMDNVKLDSEFPDVSKDIYYAKAIQATVNAGYFSGYPDGTFQPKGTLTRQEMAMIISKAYNLTGTSETKFSDISKSWAKTQIEAVAANGITVGFPDGTFQPKKSITRSEFAVMLTKSMNDDFKEKDVKTHFIDVGQGDSTLIQTPEGANILIDAGIKSAGAKVVSFLKSKDVGKLDLVISTHPHADHIGGLIPVLNAFKVDKFVNSGKVHTSQTYLDLLSLIDSKNIPLEIAKRGTVYSFDNNFKLKVLYGDQDATNLNDASVVVKAEYGNVSTLLTGDAEKSAEQKLVSSGQNLKSTIYKAGHHGSKTSSGAAFINKVKPETTILSYGEGNQYGHPNKEVVDRLYASGSKLYSTADSGNITVITNGTTHSVTAKPWVKPKPDPKPDLKPDPKPDPKPDSKPDPEPGITYPVNINKANHATLQNITGVGPVIAKNIINYRNSNGKFKKKADLKKVKGIGPVTYKKMKSQIKI